MSQDEWKWIIKSGKKKKKKKEWEKEGRKRKWKRNNIVREE